jgi:hypothetical protein
MAASTAHRDEDDKSYHCAIHTFRSPFKLAEMDEVVPLETTNHNRGRTDRRLPGICISARIYNDVYPPT